MPAKQLVCVNCKQRYWASRSDGKFCSQRCSHKHRQFKALLAMPKKPKSGVKGITFDRVTKRWQVRVLAWVLNWKYVGSFKDLIEAKRFQQEFERLGREGEGEKRTA